MLHLKFVLVWCLFLEWLPIEVAHASVASYELPSINIDDSLRPKRFGDRRLSNLSNLSNYSTSTGSSSSASTGSSRSSSPGAEWRSEEKRPPKVMIRRNSSSILANWPEVSPRTPATPSAHLVGTHLSVMEQEISEAEVETIDLEVLAYEPPSGNGDEDQRYEMAKGSHAEKTGLPIDFFDRMADATQVLWSYRLQEQAYTLPTRRYSFGKDELAEVSPKRTNTETHTNPFDLLCWGHIPWDRKYADASNPYCLLDNNAPGAFPAAIANLASNPYVMGFLKRKGIQNLVVAKMFRNMFVYSIRVSRQKEDRSGATKRFVEDKEKGPIVKHLIQEVEKLSSIIKRLEHGVLTLVNASHDKLVVRDRLNNLGVFYLGVLPPIKTAIVAPSTSMDLKELKAYLTQFDTTVHMPLFDERGCPIMTLAGENGFHIAGDADPKHMGIPASMPAMAYQLVSGKKDRPELALIGLRLLLARLTSPTVQDFQERIAQLSLTPQEQERFQSGLKALTDYVNYLNIPEYADDFIPMTERAVHWYEQNPDQLREVGMSRLHGIVTQFEFSHPLSIHGPDDIHPGSKVGEFGAILTCYQGKFVLTANERSYLALLFHDRDLLKNWRIGVHPYWLRKRGNSDYLSEYHLDLLEVQALYEAAESYERYAMYRQILDESMEFGRDTESIARDRIKARFSSWLYQGLDLLDKDKILARIHAIYAKHGDDILTIQGEL